MIFGAFFGSARLVKLRLGRRLFRGFFFAFLGLNFLLGPTIRAIETVRGDFFAAL
jgi:hypothetical protein